MRIKEFERATGLKRSAVRFYEAQGLIAPDAHPNGYRVYDATHVEAAELIKIGQALGFSIREIAALSQAWRSGALSQAEKSAVLADKLAECRAKRAQLDGLIGHLTRLIAWVDGGETAQKPRLGAALRQGR